MKIKSIPFFYHLLICLLVYVQLAFPKLVAFSVLFLFIVLFIGIRKNQFEFKLNKISIFLAVFYFCYLIGVFFTDNDDLAKHYIESKVSFILFPLLFNYKPKFKFEYSYLFLVSIFSVFQVSVVGLISAMNIYSQTHILLPSFTSTSISPLHHPTYFAVFILFSIFTAWYGYIKKWKYFSIIWIIPITVYFFGFYILCQSLAALLFLFLTFFAIFIIIFGRKFGKLKTLIAIVLFPIILFFSLSRIPVFRVEFNSTKASLKTFIHSPRKFIIDKQGYKTGNEDRLILWVASSQLIFKHPLGVGTGNVDDFMRNELMNLRQGNLALKNFNSHNQFLQTGVEIGIFGLLILLIFIFGTLYFAIKNKNWILILLIASLIFNSLFESMLQRQSGIIFYSFWICFLLSINELFLPSRKEYSEV
jgi:O-antigen ligase